MFLRPARVNNQFSTVLFHKVLFSFIRVHSAASAVWATLQSNYRCHSCSILWKLQHFTIIRGFCYKYLCMSGLSLCLMLSVCVTGISFDLSSTAINSSFLYISFALFIYFSLFWWLEIRLHCIKSMFPIIVSK